MKNASFTSKTLRLMTFALAMLLWQFAGAQTYNGSGLPLPIPLTGTGGFPCLGGPTASSANVPLTGTVNGDFFIDNVTISLTHTWNSDLAITLVSPSGTTLNLSDGNGGTSDNYINTVFKDDDATDYPNITTGTGPFTGTFNPEGPGTFSSTFGGEPINGNWTLEICDGVGGDSGQLTAFSITFASLSCEITCPDNVVAANSPGTCEGCVDIPLPDVDDACAGSPAGFVTLNSPTVQYNFDALGLIATPADVSGATADALFPVNINVTYEGDHGTTTLESFVLTGPDGSQVINTSGGECVIQNPSASVAAATWNNWVNTFGSTLTFTLQPDADVDNFCAVQQYSIEVVYATAEESAANDYNGLADASDCYPVGTTTVTYTTFDVTGAPVQCSFTVTINDEEAPVFPNCPNDILVDLLPGLCETSIVFDAEAVDNCPASSNTFDVGGQTIGGLGINCNLGLNTLPTKHYRTWTVPAGPPVSITGINTGINTSPGIVGAEYDVNVYRVTGGFPGGTLTLVASGASGVVPAGANFLHTTAVTPTQPVSAGDELVIEIDHPGGVFNFFFGYGPNNQPSWLEAVDCGAAVPTLSPSLGVPDGLVMQVSAATAGVDVARCDDIPFNSGDLWPIGSYDICFEATDEAGNPGNCNFNVTITEFSNATETLACNDNVQVSIPAAGVAEVGADMILEGGPYGCYDDYIVSIEGGDNLVGCSDIGGPWTVMVTDPDTGNKCWGSIVVEDKLDPTIECEDFAIACSQDIDDIVFDVPFGGTIVQASGARPTYDASTDNVEFTIGVPGAAQVTDINVSLNISHTWTSDLDVFLIAPNGDQITLFNDQCGTADDVDVTMDDDGAPFACSGGTPAIAGTLQPTQPLSTFNGLNPSGTWTVRVTDDAGGDATNINNITLEITYSSVYPSPVADDNCPLPFNALSFVDTEFTSDPCDGDAGQILRTWTVTDASGNTASCVQTISIDRPGLDGIMVPPFYDDIQAPAFDCDNDPFWDVNGNGYPDATVDEAGAPTINGLPIVNGDLCNFTVSFEDEVVDICPGSFKIFRSWLVIDWCAGESVEYDQIIKVVDNEGPEVVCPQGPVTINVYSGAYQQNGPHDICTGNVVIPAIEVVGDNCSGYDGSEDVTEIWTLGAGQLLGSIAGNGGTFQNIELIADNPPTNNARYTIRHRVYDGCGNLTDCLYDITVVDKIPPVAICDEITELGLTNNGTDGCTYLPAEDLDDGSYDNCGDVYFYAAQMNPFLDPPYFYQYYPELEFCCDEVGENMVILLVLDFDPTPFLLPDGSLFLLPGQDVFEGSFNTCMITVNVEDKLPPVTTQCPGPVTVDCHFYLDNLDSYIQAEDYSVLDQFGTASFFDNCDFDLDYNVNVNINTCQEGTITRTWTASDGNGSASCSQTITVVHVSDWVVEFPADVTANCEDGELPEFGEPEIYFDECELIGTSFSDQFFYVVPDACYKVVRTWTVINWCVYDDFGANVYIEYPECNVFPPFTDWDGDGDSDCRTYRDGYNDTAPVGTAGTPDGYIEYEQVIKVIDDEAPIFDVEDFEVCIEETDCDTDVTLPTPDVDDCSTGVEITVFSDDMAQYATGDQYEYADVPPGEYQVFYEVIDDCGNISYDDIIVTVKDCKLPTPYCVDGLVIEIMQTGMIDIWAVDFDAGSFDNCPGDLKLSFSPDVNDDVRIYTCDDLGENTIQLWVTDAEGNQDFCETFVVIQDNLGHCSDSLTVAGAIETEEGEGVQDVNVEVNSGLFTYNTNADGTYSFSLAAGGDYSITPMLDEDAGNGVSTYDLVLISLHILQVDQLDSPYKVIAADANNSQSVTTLDLVYIRKVILQIEDSFPNNTSWRFADKDHVFIDAMNPWNFPEVINYNNLDADDFFADFVGIKVGDVNGSATPNALSVEDRNFNGAMVLNAEDRAVKAGETFTVEFTANEMDVLGYQFTLNMDESLQLVDVVEGIATAENFGMTKLSEGAITASWNTAEALRLSGEEVLFGLTLTANADGQLSEMLNVNSRFTQAEAYNGNSELLKLNLAFNGQVASANFELYQNVPNPFKGATEIGFNLPEASEATLKITDVSGKILKVIQGNFAQGYNMVRVEGVDATGVLYYTLETATETATRKMVIIE